jgi:5-methylcytosine-specific restriction endonuclease McrA
MIKIDDQLLSQEAVAQLRKYQEAIDTITSYEERVKQAKINFSKRNKRGNRTFDEIKRVLINMCSGPRRCMYCEDSRADEVEHIYPKDLYPELTFVWENYLYICGPCNTGKNNKFSVIDPLTKTIHNVTRPPKNPVIPPLQGEALLLNPRLEDAMDYLILDLRGTFKFMPHYRLSKKDQGHIRALLTRNILDLDRNDLIESRRNAYDDYVARLEQYISRKNSRETFSVLQRRIRALQRLEHPTVWREIQRQQSRIPELRDLFDQAPEALNW